MWAEMCIRHPPSAGSVSLRWSRPCALLRRPVVRSPVAACVDARSSRAPPTAPSTKLAPYSSTVVVGPVDVPASPHAATTKSATRHHRSSQELDIRS